MSLREDLSKILEKVGLLNEFEGALSWILMIRSQSSVGFPPYQVGEPPSVTTTATALVLLTYLTIDKDIEAKVNEDIKWLLDQHGTGKVIHPKDSFAWCTAGQQPSDWATAWTVWALCGYGYADSDKVKMGVEFLLATQDEKVGGWPCYFKLEPRPLYTFVAIMALSEFLRKTNDSDLRARAGQGIINATRFLARKETFSSYANLTEVLLSYSGLRLIKALIDRKELTGYSGPNLVASLSEAGSWCIDFLRKSPDAYTTATGIFEPVPIAAGWSVWPFHPAALPALYRLKRDLRDPDVLKILRWFQQNWKQIQLRCGGWPDLQSKAPRVYATLLSLIALYWFALQMAKIRGWQLDTILSLQQEIEELKSQVVDLKAKRWVLRLSIPLTAILGFLMGYYSGPLYSLVLKVLKLVYGYEIEILGLSIIISLILKWKAIYERLKRLSKSGKD